MASSPLTLMMLSMWVLFSCSEGREYLVGGSENSWKVPLPSSDSLSQWARSHRFRIGDAIIFQYDNKTESVHAVNEDDYLRCKTKGEEHVVFRDGNTKVEFAKSGPHHFISGVKGHCQVGLKLAVVVMSDKPPQRPPSSSPSPSPSPSPLPSGVARSSGREFIMGLGLGVSLEVMMFLI